ncbi:MAG TPA: 30S ribosomal protein S19 [Planctomycetota bacterium]|nr:30S ribosomal protein S19 [Planctomycetota bacterium]
MSRSTKKGPYVDERLLSRTMAQKESKRNEPIKTWARASTLTPDFVGHTFMVHTGRAFVKVFVTEEMVGHKLGEFAPTRLFRGHGENKKETANAPR